MLLKLGGGKKLFYIIFYFNSFKNQGCKFIDTWSELHKYQKPSHQSRTAGPEGAGLLCACQAPPQGELPRPHPVPTPHKFLIIWLSVEMCCKQQPRACVIPDHRHVPSSPGMWEEPNAGPDRLVSSSSVPLSLTTHSSNVRHTPEICYQTRAVSRFSTCTRSTMTRPYSGNITHQNI